MAVDAEDNVWLAATNGPTVMRRDDDDTVQNPWRSAAQHGAWEAPVGARGDARANHDAPVVVGSLFGCARRRFRGARPDA